MILDRLRDVIVAPGTPSGHSALGVIRVSGSQTLRMCDQIFKGRKRLSDTEGHRLLNGVIIDGGEVVDEVVAGVYRSPHSYTTEDTVEFSLHGNPLIMEQVTGLLVSRGARVARPGEFTERAYLYGRIDVNQAEAVLAAIQARTPEGISAAMHQLAGNLTKEIESVASRLQKIVASVEAQLEFPEEDVPQESTSPALSELRADVERLRISFRRGRSQSKGLNVMLLGRPNVGKSTLFNALLGQDRSIVTNVPGTTRDIVSGNLRFAGGQARLHDGAGIGIAESLPDQMAARRAIAAANKADFIVVVLDAVTGLVPADEELLKLLRQKPGVIVWNKIDSAREIPTLVDVAGAPISLSALKKENLDALAERIREEATTRGEIFFANHYQEEQLAELNEFLNNALDAQYLDMKASLLRAALSLMSGTEKPDISEKLLEEIFSRFCIGK